MNDRSITALRTLRPDEDGDVFWFRDDLHQPYPISPMGMTTLQRHHAWGYHFAAEHTQLPSSRGAQVKLYEGRVYLGFTLIEDPDEAARRAAAFERLVSFCKDNWGEYYGGYIAEIERNLIALNNVDTDALTTSELLDHLMAADAANRRHWEIHFVLMYPADTIYLEFERFCAAYGVSEREFVEMLKGFASAPAETDRGLWDLAVAARRSGLEGLFSVTSFVQLREMLDQSPEGRRWRKQLGEFLARHGQRITAAHLDVIFPTWEEDPTPVTETVRTYFDRMHGGWDMSTARETVLAQQQAAVADFRRRLAPQDMAHFDRLLAVARQVYAYQEDHGFYIDQGSTAMLRRALLACGRRLSILHLLASADDVFYLTYGELVEILADAARNERVAAYHYERLVPPLVRERSSAWERARTSRGPLTLGSVPATMSDPIAVKVFGVVDSVLHPTGEDRVVSRLQGFAGSAGAVEGVARVVRDFHDFPSLQTGEILVCPWTSTAWTPLFAKIAGIVTDTGGMLTHAAIAAREYGIPAVVGTWNATSSIRDGDLLRLDGASGTVEILGHGEVGGAREGTRETDGERAPARSSAEVDGPVEAASSCKSVERQERERHPPERDRSLE